MDRNEETIWILVTSEHGDAVTDVVPHDVEGAVGGDPLADGVDLARQQRRVGVAAHQSVDERVEQRQEAPRHGEGISQPPVGQDAPHRAQVDVRQPSEASLQRRAVVVVGAGVVVDADDPARIPNAGGGGRRRQRLHVTLDHVRPRQVAVERVGDHLQSIRYRSKNLVITFLMVFGSHGW